MKRAALIFAMLGLGVPQALGAEDVPVFTFEMKDGAIIPERQEVPAKTRIKIVVKNTGTMPSEFENLELHKELVVPAGGQSWMIIRTLDPGEYKFFDDFQAGGGTPAVLIAK